MKKIEKLDSGDELTRKMIKEWGSNHLNRDLEIIDKLNEVIEAVNNLIDKQGK